MADFDIEAVTDRTIEKFMVKVHPNKDITLLIKNTKDKLYEALAVLSEIGKNSVKHHNVVKSTQTASSITGATSSIIGLFAKHPVAKIGLGVVSGISSLVTLGSTITDVNFTRTKMSELRMIGLQLQVNMIPLYKFIRDLEGLASILLHEVDKVSKNKTDMGQILSCLWKSFETYSGQSYGIDLTNNSTDVSKIINNLKAMVNPTMGCAPLVLSKIVSPNDSNAVCLYKGLYIVNAIYAITVLVDNMLSANNEHLVTEKASAMSNTVYQILHIIQSSDDQYQYNNMFNDQSLSSEPQSIYSPLP